MLIIEHRKDFLKKISKIKDLGFKERIKKQVEKIIETPDIGKPMRYDRKGTREVYLSSYRLAYVYLSSKDKIIFLDLYHKDEQ